MKFRKKMHYRNWKLNLHHTIMKSTDYYRLSLLEPNKAFKTKIWFSEGIYYIYHVGSALLLFWIFFRNTNAWYYKRAWYEKYSTYLYIPIYQYITHCYHNNITIFLFSVLKTQNVYIIWLRRYNKFVSVKIINIFNKIHPLSLNFYPIIYKFGKIACGFSHLYQNVNYVCLILTIPFKVLKLNQRVSEFHFTIKLKIRGFHGKMKIWKLYSF